MIALIGMRVIGDQSGRGGAANQQRGQGRKKGFAHQIILFKKAPNRRGD
jgi:hypothetical protein